MTKIETDRVLFRRLKESDGPAVVKYLSDLETAQKLARVPHPYRDEDWQDFFGHAASTKTEDIFALTEKPGGALMGVISFQIGRAEPVLGYWMGPPFRRQGLMKEAAIAFVRYGFEVYGAASFISGHFEDNPISGRVLTTLGFEAFTIDKEQSLARGPELIPHVTMRLTRERFEMLHPSG